MILNFDLVADDKENDLMVQLDSRPSGTISARGTPRNTPRTTPSRTFRSTSPINASSTFSFLIQSSHFLIVSHRTAGSTREPFKTNNWIYNYTLLNFWFDFEFDGLLSTIFHYLVMIREFNQLISYNSFVIEKAEGPPEASRPRVRKAPPKFYSLPHNKIAEVFLFLFFCINVTISELLFNSGVIWFQVGETVRFQCAIGGNPRPKVTWDKDNVAFKSDNLLDHIHFEEHNDNRIIEIRNIVPEVIRFQKYTIFLHRLIVLWLIFQDAGLYRITVENELGRIQANARLDVLARSSSRSSSGFIRSGSASSYGINSYYPGKVFDWLFSWIRLSWILIY